MPKVKIEELPECPVEVTLKMISSRWAVLILRDLFNGSKRNSELLQSLHGISQKVLTSNLRDMENNGLISRKVYPEVPPRVEYSLTPCGESESVKFFVYFSESPLFFKMPFSRW